jgi:LytS/YehU family sensor histidine kinase
VEEVAFYLLFYGAILYTNNLYLLPKYLKSRKFREYALIIVPVVLAAAFLESYVNKTLLKTCECEGPNSTYVIYNFIHLGSIMVIFGAVHIFRHLTENLRAYEKSENARLETELKFLKSQVNPHMLFNSLNSIYAYALENSKRVPDMVIKLSEILRYMLYECDKPLVLLEREISYLQDYIALQQMRLEDLKVTFEVKGTTHQLQIAPMIFIAFVENAFKYASQASGEQAAVTVTISVQDNELYFHCHNTFEAANNEPGDMPTENGGLGIRNARSILDISYPEKHSLAISEKNGLFTVDLRIDLST